MEVLCCFDLVISNSSNRDMSKIVMSPTNVIQSVATEWFWDWKHNISCYIYIYIYKISINQSINRLIYYTLYFIGCNETRTSQKHDYSSCNQLALKSRPKRFDFKFDLNMEVATKNLRTFVLVLDCGTS